MVKFYRVNRAEGSPFNGYFNEHHKWMLPGVICPVCGVGAAVAGSSFPCVDLSSLPSASLLTKAYLEEDFEKFRVLREMVRPFVPPGTRLRAGTDFGPLIGNASGRFGPINLVNPWMMLISAEALAALTAGGVRGLKGGKTEMRFRRKDTPELMELQIEPAGLFHRDCQPPDAVPPCANCERSGGSNKLTTDPPILDLATLPTDRDIFRLDNGRTNIIVTDRFVEEVQRLGFGADLLYHERPAR